MWTTPPSGRTRARATAVLTALAAFALLPPVAPASAAEPAASATVSAAVSERVASAPTTVAATGSRPPLTVTPLVTGLTIPWDLLFTPDGTMIYNQRAGGLWARRTDGRITKLTADFSDLNVSGEAGLMGMVVDPDFATNRQIYTCQSRTAGGTVDNRVIRWAIDAGYTTATRVGNPVITGIAQTATVHAGCRLRFDSDKLLYVSTGDTGQGPAPQDLTGLNGKVLRVTRDGAPAPGNPFVTSPNPRTRLIFTIGHRNPQGLALRPGTNQMWSVEQGTDRDDEVNRLVPGGNYGWNPMVPPSTAYDQSTPMTNPNVAGARPAVFTTGFPTLALSGGIFLSGPQWGRWNGAFLAAALKASSVWVLGISGTQTLDGVESPAELSGTYGRLRSPNLGPDGSLYLTTSNGGGSDRILKVTPGFGDERCRGSRPDPASPVATVTTGAASPPITAGYVIGTNGALYGRSIDGAAGFVDLGGAALYGPAAVSWDGVRTDVFVVGTNRELYHRWGAGGTWSGWEDLGGQLTSAPAAISFSAGTLTVLGRGTDGALWRNGWTGSRWAGWDSIGGLLSGGPGAAVDPDGAVGRIGVRGLNGELYERTLRADGSSTGFVSTSIPICSAPAYGARTGDGVGFTLAITDADGGVAVTGGGSTGFPGGILQGSPGITLTGASGFAVLGRGLNNDLWVYDARRPPAAWRDLGGQLR